MYSDCKETTRESNKVVGVSTRLIGIAAMLSCLPVAIHAKEFDFDNPQCDVQASRSVTNDHLTLNLNFCNQLTLHDGKLAKWTDSRIQPICPHQNAG